MKQYGINEIKSNTTEIERHIENILLKGFTILRSILSESEAQDLSRRSEKIYEIQKEEFGEENLKKISELDIVRIPLYYDENFLKPILQEKILEILEKVFRNQFILHLQNVIINRPQIEHHQTSWHRDIPYQEYTVSNPIAISVFYCLSPFNQKTGATKILPYIHLIESFPSIEFAEENSIYIDANPGDIVIFDSWVYHRATINTSTMVRYGLNQVFTLPILKQQINLPNFLSGRYSEHPTLSKLLGYTIKVADSVCEFRRNRLEKVNSKNL